MPSLPFISCLGPNTQLSTKRLPYKLVGLLALTATDRASGLAARDLRFRYFHPAGVQFKLPELTKTAKQGHEPKLAFLKTNVCVYASACRLELCNGRHRTPQNLTSFCYLTYVLTNQFLPPL